MDPAVRLLDLISSSWKTHVVAYAAKARLDELLATPRTAEEVAQSKSIDPRAAHQLLRAMASLDLVRGNDPYEITELGRGLTRFRNWAEWWSGPAASRWSDFERCLQTGLSSAQLRSESSFDFLAQQPGLAAVFGAAMSELTSFHARAIAGAFPFNQYESVLDVGGGDGTLLRIIREVHGPIRATVFDAADASPIEGIDRIVGDFREGVPSGFDLYLMKSVLHDWSDADAVAILRNVARAAGTVVLVERVMPTQIVPDPLHQAMACMDLHMLVSHGSGERTEDEFRALLRSAGLAEPSIRPLSGGLSLIVTRPL